MSDENTTGRRIFKIVIIFILVTAGVLVGTNFLQARSERNQRRETIRRMKQVEEGLEKYFLDSGGELPTSKQGLQALVEPPESGPQPRTWNGPYVQSRRVLEDAWGRDFHYICPGREIPGYEELYEPYALWSYGEDGREGGEDAEADINSWDRTTMMP